MEGAGRRMEGKTNGVARAKDKRGDGGCRA